MCNSLLLSSKHPEQMALIKDPDFYITLKNHQFKTPLEILRKNFKNLQKLTEKNQVQITHFLNEIQTTNDTTKKKQLIDELIKAQESFHKKLSSRVKQHNSHVDKLLYRVKRIEHIDKLHENYSSWSSVDINKNKLTLELVNFYREENNLMIVDYILWNSVLITTNPELVDKLLNINNGSHYNDLSKLIDFDIIQQALRIKNDIAVKKDLKLLKMWCVENRRKLQILRDSPDNNLENDIEFECDFQHFLSLIKEKKYVDAIVYAKTNLKDHDVLHKLEKLSKGLSIIWSNYVLQQYEEEKLERNNEESYYYTSVPSDAELNNTEKFKEINMLQSLLSDNKWVELSEYFIMNFKLIYGINQIQPFKTFLNIGGSVLKTRSCNNPSHNYDKSVFQQFIGTNMVSFEKFYNNIECPVCSVELSNILKPLPYSLQTKSTLFDDPILLHQKYVHSFKSLFMFNRSIFLPIGGADDPDRCFDLIEISPKNIHFKDHKRSIEEVVDPLTGTKLLFKDCQTVFPT